ncbi:putative RNA-binding protein EEED8.10 [Aphidius gifuensis]|uniref:putative RNA-binding protein EEED8.10 n=1 Tax=Aphidius gifuensis TaxID=684658 RepID=UPI001CDB906C|nr:putative RNA-binding protein EEED8.10 [Aphidius gifuensis]
METITSEAQWIEVFNSISLEFQLEQIKIYGKYDDQSTDDYDSEDDFDHHEDDSSGEERSTPSPDTIFDNRMIQMRPLFALQPTLESICNDRRAQLINSAFTIYRFTPPYEFSINELQKLADDLKCTFHLWGHNLKELYIRDYPYQILQTINTICPNLKKLWLDMEELDSEDCENAFSNMAHLEELEITWSSKNSTLPTSLIKSIEQVGGTLKSLRLINVSEADRRLPDSFVSVFPRLIVLEYLYLYGFGDLNQALIQSIAEIESLVDLELIPIWVEDLQSTMNPIGNLKNLKRLNIRTDCGVTDEFLINLGNNAKNLNELTIDGTSITDRGIMALNKCTQLEILGLNSRPSTKNNEFITDQSVEYLFFNKKLERLNISNCIKITHSAVLKLAKHLTNLRELYLKKTLLTVELAKELRNITEYRKKSLWIYVSKEQYDCFNSLESDKLCFIIQRDSFDIYKH